MSIAQKVKMLITSTKKKEKRLQRQKEFDETVKKNEEFEI